MNDAIITETQRAMRVFTQGTPEQAREALEAARRLDRTGSMARFFMVFEAACRIREHRQLDGEQLLLQLMPVSDKEWVHLNGLLQSAPERRHQAFEDYRKSLRARLESGHNPAPQVSVTPDPMPANSLNSVATPPVPPPIPHDPSKVDALSLTSLILGICSAFLFWFPPLGLPISIVGLVLGGVTRYRGGLWIAGLVVSLVATLINTVCFILWIIAIKDLSA